MKAFYRFLSLGLLTLVTSFHTSAATLGTGPLQLIDCDGVGYAGGCLKADNVSPLLRFTDITSGPDTGLSDGLGSGSIITVWGQGLGEQGTNRVLFTDANGDQREASHVYYWKKADGTAPGGPANLYESHRMYEVAFSLPDGVDGPGQITLEIGGTETNSLPFTVRAGNIYWMDPTGSNANDCSYATPCEYINGNIDPVGPSGLGDGLLSAGDIVYSKGVTEPEFQSGGVYSGLFLRSVVGTQSEPVSLIAYPGAHSKVVSTMGGLTPYLSEGIVIAKYHMSVGQQDDPIDPIDPGSNSNRSDFHIKTSKYGRAVGNLLDERPGKCFNGWSGAITSGGSGGSEYKAYGNHLVDLGCDTTSHFQHTTYFSVRNSTAVGTAWDFSFNYLEANKAKYGVHFYDETNTEHPDCGQLTGTLKATNNVIVDQKGTGINIYTNDGVGDVNPCWSADIEVTNNILINVGLGPIAELNNGTAPVAISIGGDMTPTTVTIEDNLVYGYSDESSRAYATAKGLSLGFDLTTPTISVKNNLFWNNVDVAWTTLNNGTSNLATDSNLFYNTAGSTTAVVPAGWTNTITNDPKLRVISPIVDMYDTGAGFEAGANTGNAVGIYGGSGNNIGPVEVE